MAELSPNGSSYMARVVSFDSQQDLALIKIDPVEPLDVMVMGTSSDLMLGETVIAVGNAYVSRWYPKEKQGTALGIFGAGNVGAAVTKFCAPFVLVAFGWTAVAQVWAVALLAMAVVFWFTTDDDPQLKARRASGGE